ncbi:GntR family transcriptional regulator [Sphingomonas sp. AR_OL41]|jgi:DNA-binding GntR family transcriptional regulator|uniref:GntR family transcriptional regulator n=1 Tax=Facivitalis istanbulensis TaxID=3075838 RepID=UPI002480511E|nr:GntR family transcriptional regulator [Sphingomonas sp. AR_OL41]MDH7970715.1 GntR family transcriptional regulator [Sphingomonas sp. AR_OL41]
MAPEAVTSERVYAGLRRAVVGGRYPPGTTLNAQAIAEEFGTSIAPVRDAMHRLVGEGLIEAHHGGGFQIPTLSEDGLRDLYVWHGQVLRLAIKHRSSPSISIDMSTILDALDPTNTNAIADATTELFFRLAEGSRNAQHALTIERVGDRLYATRLRETVIKDRVEELRAVWTVTASGRESAVRDAIWAYHRRRLRRVPALIKELSRPL